MADKSARASVQDELYCSSSSFDESNEDSADDDSQDQNFHQLMGVKPYCFEPEGESDSETENVEHVENETMDDVDGDEWCSCDNCRQMASQDECKCCKSIPAVIAKVQEYTKGTGQSLQCVLQHPGFQSVCLDRYVLETAYYQYRQQYGDRHPEEDNKRRRYTAYRQLARWCWGYLGKEVRVVLPSCAVCKIRDTFPSEDYEGFHHV